MRMPKSTPVRTITAVSKVAAVASLLRMISLAQDNSDLLARGLIAMAVVSMTVGNLQINELAGLHHRSPLLALAVMMALFSLAGIPPTVGFAGKLMIFLAAMQKGYLVLVLIAMANVVISLYYYLLVLKAPTWINPPSRCRPSA